MNVPKKIRDKYSSVDVPPAENVLPREAVAQSSKKEERRGNVKLFLELAASAAALFLIIGAVLAGQGALRRQNRLPLGEPGDGGSDILVGTEDLPGDTTSAPSTETGDKSTAGHATGNPDTSDVPEITTADPPFTTEETEDVASEPDTTTPRVVEPTGNFDTTAAPEPDALGLTGDETIVELNEKLVGKKFSELEKYFGESVRSVDGDAANKKLAKKNWSLSSLEGVKLYKIPFDSKNYLNVGVEKSSGEVLWVYPAYSYEDDAYDVLLLRENYRYDEDPVMPLSEFPPTGNFMLGDPEYEVLWGIMGLKEADLTSRWGAPSSSGVWSTVYGTYTVKITFNSKGYAVDLDCEKAANPQRNGVKMPASLEAAVKMTDKELTSALKNMPGYALTELFGTEGRAKLLMPGQDGYTANVWVSGKKAVVIRMDSRGYATSATVKNVSDMLYDGKNEYISPLYYDNNPMLMVVSRSSNLPRREISRKWMDALLAAEYNNMFVPSDNCGAYTVDADFLPAGSEIVYFGDPFGNDITYLCHNGRFIMLTFCPKDENGNYVFDSDGYINVSAKPVARFMPVYDAKNNPVGFFYSYGESMTSARLGFCDLITGETADLATITAYLGMMTLNDKTVTITNGSGTFTVQANTLTDLVILAMTAEGYEIFIGNISDIPLEIPTGAKYTLSIKSSGVEITAG